MVCESAVADLFGGDKDTTRPDLHRRTNVRRHVGPGAHNQPDASCVASQNIVASAAKDGVIAHTAVDSVVARLSGDPVVPSEAIDSVIPGVADQLLGAGPTRQRLGLQECDVPNRAVVESGLL